MAAASDFSVLEEALWKGELIKEADVERVCDAAKDVFVTEANVQRILAPACIVGDIHGQFYDLLEVFYLVGRPPKTNFVFLGDYVDRGYHSVECILLLLILKIKYPSRVTLLRGNHESRQITQVYGFYDECLKKFGSVNVWRYCTDVFDHLPLCAIIDQKIFCVHAGLSPSIRTLDFLNDLDRHVEVPHEGPMCDLLWSDPDPDLDGWGLSERGAGFFFGSDVVREFNRNNSLDCIVRSHQLVMEGYKTMFNDSLFTVWSAPNYCYRCNNVASVMDVDESLKRDFKMFQASPLSVPPSDSNGSPSLSEYFL